MAHSPSAPGNPDVPPEPAWDIALLYPPQGQWSEEEYLALSGNRLIEFSHGIVEILGMPTDSHQAIVAYLYAAIWRFVSARELGTLRFAPLRLRLWDGKFRAPDLLFLRAERDALRGETYWQGADLVIEVVSPDDRRRDLVVKRREYARAGIPEYWIVDPTEGTISVLSLPDEETAYATVTYERGMQIASTVLPGFTLQVDDVLAAQ